MNTKRLLLTLLGGAALSSAVVLATARQEPEMPEPSAEHEHMLGMVGTWDCAMKMWMAPGTEPMTATAVETCRAVGPFHVIGDFESEMMGMKFEGTGVSSYDPSTKTFMTIWVDSTQPTPTILEGTYDESTHALTFTGEGLMMGERMKMRQVAKEKDADNRTFDMYVTPPGGEEMQTMHLEYTRRK